MTFLEWFTQVVACAHCYTPLVQGDPVAQHPIPCEWQHLDANDNVVTSMLIVRCCLGCFHKLGTSDKQRARMLGMYRMTFQVAINERVFAGAPPPRNRIGRDMV